MSILRPDKQPPLLAIIMLFMISPPAHSANCVVEYLDTTLKGSQAAYRRVRRVLQVGRVPFLVYENRKEIEELSSTLRRSEIGEITGLGLRDVDWLKTWISKIHERGGELRLLEVESTKDPQLFPWKKTSYRQAYFSYDWEKHVPYIAITEDATPEVLAHEFDHFEKWIARRKYFLDRGFYFQHAGRAAAHLDPKTRQYIERTAVAKELQEESKLQRMFLQDNPVDWRYPTKALPLTDLETLTRSLTYPESEALRFALVRRSPEAATFMRELIRKVLLLRLTAYRRAQIALSELPISQNESFWKRLWELRSDPGARRAYFSRPWRHTESGLELDFDSHIQFMQELENFENLFESVFKNLKIRFERDGVYTNVEELFEKELPSVWKSISAEKRGDFKPRFKKLKN